MLHREKAEARTSNIQAAPPVLERLVPGTPPSLKALEL